MLVLSCLLVGIVSIVLQTTIFQFLPDWIGKIDPLFILIVFLGLRLDYLPGTVISIILGLIMDIFSGIFMGLYPLLYLFLFLIIKTITQKLIIEEHRYKMVLVGISFLLSGSGVWIIINTFIDQDGIFPWSWKTVCIQALLTGAISFPFFYVYHKVWSLSRTKKKSGFRR